MTMSWTQVIDIGHTAVMLPVAGAIAAWLVAGQAWRTALWWCGMFTVGLSVVALSKIVFLGWQVGIPALDFEALSGHAYRSAAAIPVLFFVLLQASSMGGRTGGVFFGMVVSAGIAVLLVRFDFHTASEVIASFILGSVVSLGFMRLATTLPAPRLTRWTVPLSVLALIVIWRLKPSSLSHRLLDVALFLSGREQ
jgi:hypothetical protein